MEYITILSDYQEYSLDDTHTVHLSFQSTSMHVWTNFFSVFFFFICAFIFVMCLGLISLYVKMEILAKQVLKFWFLYVGFYCGLLYSIGFIQIWNLKKIKSKQNKDDKARCLTTVIS